MSSESSQLRHDLRGAAVNISGFHGECTLAAEELRQLLDAHAAGMDEALRSRLLHIIDDDLIACLRLLATAIEQLDGTIGRVGDSEAPGVGHAS